MKRNGDYGVGSLVIFKRKDDRAGVSTKKAVRYKGATPHWEVLMLGTGKTENVLVTNLANGRNTRYEIK